MRDLVRTRKSLVEERTAEKNRVRAVLKRTDNAYDSELFGPTGREFLAELSLTDADRTIIEAHLSVIDEQIDVIEEKVLESLAAQLLLTIPGVGQSTSAVVVAEAEKIDRFDRHEELVSYAGLDLMVTSQVTQRSTEISKEGSAPLRWALVQSAHIAVRCAEYFGNFYTRLKDKKNHQIAIVAMARKLLVSIFYMLKRKEPYDPPGVSA